MANKVKFISLNVRGVNNPIKRTKILSYCQKEKADVIYLQETHLNAVESRKLMNGKFFVAAFSPAMKKRNGVAILIRWALAPTISHINSDVEGSQTGDAD